MPTTRWLQHRRVAARRLPSNSRGRLDVLLTCNSMKRRSSYKVTFFDRHGPEGLIRMKAFAYGLLVFGICLAGFPLILGKLGVDPLIAIPITLIGSATLG